MKCSLSNEQWENKPLRAKKLLAIHRRAENELKGIEHFKSPLILSIGQQLREKRLSKRLTLKELGKLSGIGYAYIAKLESGQVNPSIQTLEILIKHLGCRLEIDLVRIKVPEA
jgi:DNA-binding XRE family transcriptional regulator